ncbi:LysE family translocator [Streptomyces sp. NPDC093991]|uniref:LysE family translocator n=1 Tax=unclassified Streptomyces TaxID=2593676 RepID=UPI00341C805A
MRCWIVAGSPTVLTALTIAGAGYLVWLGWNVLRRPAMPAASKETTGSGSSRMQTMLEGAGISGLNPKTLLLYLSLFPQFIGTTGGGWPVAAQTGLFGILHRTAYAAVCLTVAVLARTVLRARPSAVRAVTRASGVLMILIGLFLLAERLVA